MKNNDPGLFEILKEQTNRHADVLRSGHVICRYCLLPYPVKADDPEMTENRKPLCDDCVEIIKKTR